MRLLRNEIVIAIVLLFPNLFVTGFNKMDNCHIFAIEKEELWGNIFIKIDRPNRFIPDLFPPEYFV